MPLRAVIATLLLCALGVSARAGTLAYGEAFDTLYAFDLTTRTAAPIGVAGSYGGTALSNIEGLTFSPQGQLYAVSDTQLKVLMTIDRNSGAASVIGPLGGGLAFQHVGVPAPYIGGAALMALAAALTPTGEQTGDHVRNR